jgi:ribonucleoside-diphosphate reductase alpha chain
MDTIVKNDLIQDWEKLRKEMAQHGIRNATLMAIMPSETSAIISNSTNGVEPPRALVSVKSSKDGSLKQVVPEIQRLKNKYELLWDQKSPKGYLALMGVFNKFLCQSISTNTSYNPDFFEERKIPMSVILEDIIFAYQLGLRTLYYNNEYDGSKEINVSEEMEKIDIADSMEYIRKTEVYEDEENCDACSI